MTTTYISSKFAESAENMSKEFEMSMVGELSFFLGLQIKKCMNGIFVFQTKYARNLLKKFGITASKHSRIPMSATVKLSLEIFYQWDGNLIIQKEFQTTAC